MMRMIAKCDTFCVPVACPDPIRKFFEITASVSCRRRQNGNKDGNK